MANQHLTSFAKSGLTLLNLFFGFVILRWYAIFRLAVKFKKKGDSLYRLAFNGLLFRTLGNT
jgi:hypothetical protein